MKHVSEVMEFDVKTAKFSTPFEMPLSVISNRLGDVFMFLDGPEPRICVEKEPHATSHRSDIHAKFTIPARRKKRRR